MSEQTEHSTIPGRTNDPLAKFPAEVRDAYARYKATGDVDAIDIVVLAGIRDFIPRHIAPPANQPLAESARLMADLGYDSLAIAETVFFFEDLFDVKISNKEIMQISTVGELRTFVRTKLAAHPAR
ncbi:MAG: acyl carrier protein [Nibricoccus sp.]